MKINTKKGFAPTTIIIVLAMMLGGISAVYLKNKDKPITLESVKENILRIEGEATLDNIKIDTDDIRLSLTEIPSLELPSLNINVPETNIPKIGLSSSQFFNFDIPIKQDSIDIKMPSLDNITPVIKAPEIQTPPKTNSGVTPPPGSAPQIDCSMFESVPSCSYVPAGQAQDACRQCFPNK